MAKIFIIAKYVDEFYRPHNYQFHISDSAARTYTGRQVGCPDCFASETEAESWLEKMNEVNPSVGYAVVEVIDK